MSHAPTPAFMKPEKVIAILEELLLEAQTNSASWHRLAPGAKAWAQNVRGALVHGFGHKNAQLDSFNSEWESWFMVKGDSPSELRQSFVERFPAVLGALQSAIRQLRWQLDDSSQVF